MNKPTKWQLAKFFTHFGFTGYGGVAMLPYIRRDLVERKKYLDSEQFDFGLAMAQMLPGATLVQVATYTGYQTQGYVGAFIAALGIFAPAALLIYLLSIIYFLLKNMPFIPHVITGMNAVIVIILIDATSKTAISNLRTLPRCFTALCGFVLYYFDLNAVGVILVSAGLGFLVCRDRAPGATQQSVRQSGYFVYCTYILLIAIAIALWIWDHKAGVLAALMFKTGLLAYGGGYAAIPIYMNDAVFNEHWLTMQQFMVGLTLGQITPGPVIVTAIYIGYSILGSLGALVAFCFLIFPDMLLTLLVLPIFNKLISSPWFYRTMQGVLCAFAGMLLSVCVTMARELVFEPLTIVLLLISAYAILVRAMQPYWLILLAILLELSKYVVFVR